jgi:hypothetical protein
MSATQYFGDHWSFSAAWAHAGNMFAFLVSLLLLCGVPSLLSASQIDSAQVAKKVTVEGKLMTRQQWRGPRTRAPYLTMIGQAVAPDTRVTIISDHNADKDIPAMSHGKPSTTSGHLGTTKPFGSSAARMRCRL